MADETEAQSLPIVTRKEAQAAGLVRFFTGKPCKNGHISERQTRNKSCLACSLANTMAWINRNKSTVALKKKVYRAANAEKIRAYGAEYRKTNPWVPKPRDPAKTRQQHLAWYAKNAAHAKFLAKRWFQQNREKARAICANRRARLSAAPGRYTGDDVLSIFARQKGRCACCRGSIKRGYHVDHLMPLSKGGSNDPRNLQLLCPTCNMKKHAKHPIEFARERGLLL